ncbi:MAG: type II toxin-antitoxin system HicB family antitoxin [Candidatus Solibacter usitatus]|nr:type II toxin-antitoxin system HicB family antitoxin [Candidatus Solibacter usitatus]
MTDYETIVYPREDGVWIAEVPAMPGCWAIGESRADALWEVGKVFQVFADDYRQTGRALPKPNPSS